MSSSFIACKVTIKGSVMKKEVECVAERAGGRKKVVIAFTSKQAPTYVRKVINDAPNKKDHFGATFAPDLMKKEELPVPARFFAAPQPSPRPLASASASQLNLFSTVHPPRASSVTLSRPVPGRGAEQRPSCRRVCARQSDSLHVIGEENNSSSQGRTSAAGRAPSPTSGRRSATPQRASGFLQFDGEDHSAIRFSIRVPPNTTVKPLSSILPQSCESPTPQRRVPTPSNMEKMLTGDPTAPSPRCSSLRTNIRKNSPPSVDFRTATATLRHPIATPQPSALFGSDKAQRPGVCCWDYKLSAMYRPQGSALIRQVPPSALRNRETTQQEYSGITGGRKRASSAPRSQLVLV